MRTGHILYAQDGFSITYHFFGKLSIRNGKILWILKTDRSRKGCSHTARRNKGFFAVKLSGLQGFILSKIPRGTAVPRGICVFIHTGSMPVSLQWNPAFLSRQNRFPSYSNRPPSAFPARSGGTGNPAPQWHREGSFPWLPAEHPAGSACRYRA